MKFAQDRRITFIVERINSDAAAVGEGFFIFAEFLPVGGSQFFSGNGIDARHFAVLLSRLLRGKSGIAEKIIDGRITDKTDAGNHVECDTGVTLIHFVSSAPAGIC